MHMFVVIVEEIIVSIVRSLFQEYRKIEEFKKPNISPRLKANNQISILERILSPISEIPHVSIEVI